MRSLAACHSEAVAHGVALLLTVPAKDVREDQAAVAEAGIAEDLLHSPSAHLALTWVLPGLEDITGLDLGADLTTTLTMDRQLKGDVDAAPVGTANVAQEAQASTLASS